MQQRFGWRAICLFSDRQTLREGLKNTWLQDSDRVAAHYLVGPGDWSRLGEHLAANHAVGAVIPYFELSLPPLLRLAEQLKLDWAQPDLTRWSRDKNGLKSLLRERDPSIHLNYHRLVSTPTEAIRTAREQGLTHWLLKPNDGFGNFGLRFFDEHSTLADMARDWPASSSSDPLLLEEVVNGEEFHCNGQVDAHGNILMIDIARYVARRGPTGMARLRNEQVSRRDPEFNLIVRYVTRCVTASGLRRSPFHAEVIIGPDGPVLIECSARLVGTEGAFVSNLTHGSRFNIFDLAAHYYGSGEDYGPTGLDWDHYDDHCFLKIRGVAERRDVLMRVEGVEQVEALPGFVHWIQRPEIGQFTRPTEDLFSSSWHVVMDVGTAANAEALDARVRGSIQLNTPEPSRWARFLFKQQSRLHELPRRVRRRLPLPTGSALSTY
jgi:hypothetical protein